MSDGIDQLDAGSVLGTVEQVAAQKPLAHPLTFAISQMNFPLAPPPHLVDIYHDVYAALNPDIYPYAPRHIAKIMPRDHGKSEAGSHVLPSWKALNDPNSRILIMMESEGQAKDKLAECSETINRLAPKFGREIVNDAAFELKLERDEVYDVPTIRAAGFETSVTGGHYDLIIFDDLVGDESMMTEHRRDKAWGKFQERLNLRSGEDTCFLVLGTRKHPEDIYQRLLDSPGWDVDVERAISDWSIVENGEYDVITRGDGGAVNRYPAGERPHDENIVRVEPHRDVDVLWPDRYSLGELIHNYLTGSLDDKAEGEGDTDLSGSRVWIRENQNRADALMGHVLSRGMLTFVDGIPDDRDPTDLLCYGGLDVATEADPEKAATDDLDYFALAVTYYEPRTKTFYVDDIRRTRGKTMKQAVDWVASHMERYHTSNIYVESNSAQAFLAQTLRDEGLYIKEVDQMGNKEDRIQTMSARFENGKAVIVGSPHTPRWDSFISEWTQFPTGDHDDRLDAVCLALSAKATEDEEKRYTSPSPFV